MKPITLSTGLGEILAPQTLMVSLVLSADGTIRADPGAIHGRSELEQSLCLVQQREQVPNPATAWFVWVAVELDSTNRPVRYKGIAVSEFFLDPQAGVGCKSLAESVNRMDEAMRGGINLKTLSLRERSSIAGQLMALGTELWERSEPRFKEAMQK